jgi:hypothetical protein
MTFSPRPAGMTAALTAAWPGPPESAQQIRGARAPMSTEKSVALRMSCCFGAGTHPGAPKTSTGGGLRAAASALENDREVMSVPALARPRFAVLPRCLRRAGRGQIR